MQLMHVTEKFSPDDSVRADLDRIETLWDWARGSHDGTEPWLMGAYSLADVFFAPVAARIVGYDLPVSDDARKYVMQVISDPAFRDWRAEALKVTYDPVPYATGLPTRAWPV